MKSGEKLYNSITNVSEGYIEEAQRFREKKKSPAWGKWGLAVACLCLVAAAVIMIFPKDTDDEVEQISVSSDEAPMVYINNILYQQSASQISFDEKKDDFIYLGEITSTSSDGFTDKSGTWSEGSVPRENFQANTRIEGSEVYQYGEDIVVFTNGKYWLYEIAK